MVQKIKISVVAAAVALTMTGCVTTKAELTNVTPSNLFETVHHCAVYTEVGKCKMSTLTLFGASEATDGDDDNDGVLNSVDKCPRTAPYTKVDEEGCLVVKPDPVVVPVPAPAPKPVDGDDDKDGVLNSADKCPSTNSNVKKVDADGCALQVNLNVNFEFDSFNVTEEFVADILSFGYFMNEHTSYKANIEGHTDSSGPAEYNKMLSQKRAQAVTDLIVSKGNVDASRLTAVGKGESTPIADNATKAGRTENRRTEAHIIK